MSRKLFNIPIRKETTEEFFPEKIDIEHFRAEITQNFEAYKDNMVKIRASEPKYIEEWVEQYLAWLEIETE